MSEFDYHLDCKYYNWEYDECIKFLESNMSERIKLCECSMRKGCEKVIWDE